MNKKQLFIRTFKDVWKIGKGAFLYQLMTSLLVGAVPFLNFIYLSKIVTTLAQGRFDEVYTYVWHYLLLFFTVNFLASWLQPIASKKDQLVKKKILAVPYEKILTTNFHYADDSETKEKLFQVHRDQFNNGSSFHLIYQHFYGLIRNAVNLFYALLLLWPLWQARAHETINGLHPYFMNIILIIVVVLVAVFQTYLSQRTMQGVNELAEWLVKANNLFSYFYITLIEVEAGKEIRLYHLYHRVRDTMERFFSELSTFQRVYYGGFGRVRLTNHVGSQIVTSFVYLLIGIRVILGNMPIGMLIQMIGGIGQLMSALVDTLNFLTLFAQTAPMERFYEIMDLPDENAQGSIPIEKRLDNHYQLSVENLSFTFPGSQEPTLKNISEEFEIGKHYAIVGENGSGKTTFIKLLMRLYEPNQGKVFLNHIEADKYSLSEFYQLFSVVFQDFRLLGLTIAENIAVHPNYEADRVRNSLEEIGLAYFTDSLEEGVNTYLGTEYDENGVEVSGGQAQKIAMARAIYKDAPIMILDEPTAALDPVAEFEIYQKFSEIVKDKTAFYISHRLSSCRFCDEILVFDQGSIIQRGTHEELVKERGKYQDLWQAQVQYYQ